MAIAIRGKLANEIRVGMATGCESLRRRGVSDLAGKHVLGGRCEGIELGAVAECMVSRGSPLLERA
jgi:hypothetical protein